MKRILWGLLVAAVAAGSASMTVGASADERAGVDRHGNTGAGRPGSFQRVATFAGYRNNGSDAAEETVSEIIAASASGRTLVYTDAVRLAIGLIDITNPAAPQPLGTFPLDLAPEDDVDHSPTSVDILGDRYALVAVDTTSGAFATPSGYLAVVDISNPAAPFLARAPIDLAGQPDSVKISPDGRYLAIAIENQRNEDLCVGGTLDGTEADEDDCVQGGGVLGGLPQGPGGGLAVIALGGPPASWVPQQVSLTGLALYAPDDPEPEFVDVNARNEAVVTLQENNHVVVVDLTTLKVKSHFSAGAVTLKGVDAVEDGRISLTDTLEHVRREPDATAWLPGPLGTLRIGTANEGDLFGGSRGFSIFHQNGAVAFDSGTSFEALAVRHGHYPEDRSDAKGSEPEAIAYARFGAVDYLFVGSERGSFIAVYTLDRHGRPVFDQLLPAPFGPEGLLVIPERGLLVASGENDLEGVALRSTVAIYQWTRGQPTYPQILSANGRTGRPIAWGALSGMVADPWRPHSVLAVSDSAYEDGYVFRIDVSQSPAVIREVLTITPGSIGSGRYDAEGIVVAPDRTLWVASEGNATDTVPNRLVQLDGGGDVLAEVGLPADILACRAATTGAAARRTLGAGFEGLAVIGGAKGTYRLAVVQQRGWNYTTPACEALDDDEGGLNPLGEPNWTRIWIYDPVAATWTFLRWELAPLPTHAAWVGLSELTALPDGDLVAIERDNLSGDFAAVKTLVKVSPSAAADRRITQGEKVTFDVLPRLRATNGWVSDKLEGIALTRSGLLYVSTDNDGVDDWSGETWFFGLGRYWEAFR